MILSPAAERAFAFMFVARRTKLRLRAKLQSLIGHLGLIATHEKGCNNGIARLEQQ
jgi:hypothetical protein